jgi:hypothetical protein
MRLNINCKTAASIPSIIASKAVYILALLLPTITPPAIGAVIRFLILIRASTVKQSPIVVTTHEEMHIIVLNPAFE